MDQTTANIVEQFRRRCADALSDVTFGSDPEAEYVETWFEAPLEGRLTFRWYRAQESIRAIVGRVPTAQLRPSSFTTVEVIHAPPGLGGAPLPMTSEEAAAAHDSLVSAWDASEP